MVPRLSPTAPSSPPSRKFRLEIRPLCFFILFYLLPPPDTLHFIERPARHPEDGAPFKKSLPASSHLTEAPLRRRCGTLCIPLAFFHRLNLDRQLKIDAFFERKMATDFGPPSPLQPPPPPPVPQRPELVLSSVRFLFRDPVATSRFPSGGI